MRTEAFASEETFRWYCKFLDAFRLQKVNQCKGTEDKVRSLCCGLLLQYAVWQETGKKPPIALRYGIGAYGKPYLLDHPRLHFNLSHSGSYAALAVSDAEVGIDIQQSRPVKEAFVKRVLCTAEYEQYERQKALSDKEAEDYFFRCWCAKESYGKLCGLGLGRVLAEACCEAEKGYIAVQNSCIPCRDYRIGKDCRMNACVYERETLLGIDFPKEVTCLQLSHILS